MKMTHPRDRAGRWRDAILLCAIGLSAGLTLATACVTGEGDAAGGAQSTATNGSTATTGVGGGGAGGGGAGGGAPQLPTCQIKCAAPFDCATPTPATDEDNWDCVDTQCEYLGCNTSEECMETFQSGNYTCAKLPGNAVATCNPTCAAPFDCATPTPATDEDNWDCVETQCVYLGCNTSEECMETFQSGNYTCAKLAGAAVATCNPTCARSFDCATESPLTDVDNWTCVDASCVYLGCLSDQECMETYQNGNYLCVAP
jgi:hypothetical protein